TASTWRHSGLLAAVSPATSASWCMIRRVIDVTETFIRARERGHWPVETLVEAVPADPNLRGMRIEWDREAGEDWLRVLKTSMVLALVWVPCPLVIATSGHH